ncbi:MAG: hypothetical protein EOP84_04205 [Verrucomicrobiaceae bacterium]|nr:MAG: hypothetical protein EOP84_04205 [Verrucomicrobiaceae bacterium]
MNATLRLCLVGFSLFFLEGVSSFAEVAVCSRAAVDSPVWKVEKQEIIASYKKNLNPTDKAKIIPLLISARLLVQDSISRNGVVLSESVFVYSEDADGKGGVSKRISAFIRYPYVDRVWNTDVAITTVEQGDSWSSVLEIVDGKDKFEQVSNFIRKFTKPEAAGIYTISMVLFEGADKEIFGRMISDADLKRMCDHTYTDP